MSSVLTPIDWLTIRKSLAELAESKRKDARQAQSLSVSDDKQISVHKDYWLSLQQRYLEMARIYDELRESLE